ncbi:hypothetical protein BDQ17DRAFT_1439128, partial [Cyathus striatus]
HAKVIKSVETVDSDSNVEVVTAQATAPIGPAVPAVPVVQVPVIMVPAVVVPATDASLNSTDMLVDDTAAPTPVVTQPAAEAHPEAVVAKKRVRVDLTFPKFPDVCMWVMNVINSIEGHRFPDKLGQSLSFREAVITQQSADLLAAATKIEQYIVAMKSMMFELNKMSAASATFHVLYCSR